MKLLAMFVITILSQAQPAKPAPKGAQIDEAKLEKRTSAVVCTSGARTFDGVHLKVAATAIQASGDCRITIKNSHIVSPAAIQMTGNSEVTIENTLVEGSVALQLTENAKASIKSSTIRGQVQKVGDVKVSDLGDNLWK